MPLTLELYGSDPEKTGHLIIDRNNLIITYLSSSKEAWANRNRLYNLINTASNHFKHFFSKDLDLLLLEPSDPRHDALEHMCEYDKTEFHSHLSFEKDVNFDVIKAIFSNLRIDGYRDLVSEKCIENILNISKEYFSELETTESLRKIEANYRVEKKKENEKAVASVAQSAEPPYISFYNGNALINTLFGNTFVSSLKEIIKNLSPTVSNQENEDRKIILKARK